MDYDLDRLRSVCEKAMDRFGDFLLENGDPPLLGKSIDTDWLHPDDCFYRVGLKMGRNDRCGMYFVSLWVWIKGSRYRPGGGIATFVLDGKTTDEIREGLRNPEIRDQIFRAACSLIRKHFEDPWR